MKLIREEINEAQYIIEEDNGKKSHKIKGIFMQANIKIEMAVYTHKKF